MFEIFFMETPARINSHFAYICVSLNIRDILDNYKADERIMTLAQALNAAKNPRIQLRGLVGSGDSAVAVALYFLLHKHMIFVLPDRDEAGYFQADLENLTGKEILLFPSSYRKPFEFTQPDSSNVLARAEVLNELNHSSEFGSVDRYLSRSIGRKGDRPGIAGEKHPGDFCK